MAAPEVFTFNPEKLSDAEVEARFDEIVETIDLVVTPEEGERLDLIEHAAKGARSPEFSHSHYHN